MTDFYLAEQRRQAGIDVPGILRRSRAYGEERVAQQRRSDYNFLAALALMAAIFFALTCFFAVPRAHAEASKPPLTVSQALQILGAMRNLDGHIVIVKGPDGKDGPVVQPWDFGSGALRMRIAKNTTALADVEKGLEDARQSIVKEILKALPGATAIPQDTPQWSELQRQYGEALNAPAAVTLSRIKASELKLDRNEIPGSTLAAMAPILDDDVTPKGDGK